ncbi:methyltransferase domain-containing protein [Actinophytocola sp.]|uniref:class I SAM-dependent methyltransferase n=1 Tax=Actinophytocola sp. TaxID=1872138 RepID=UPI003899C160
MERTSVWPAPAKPAGYLPNLSSRDVEEIFRREHPHFADVLAFDRAGAADALARLARQRNEFETDDDGGRGRSYRDAQRSTGARLTGITALLRMLTGHPDLAALPPGLRLLDVLGGDGLVTRAWRSLAADDPASPILTSDLAGHMVAAALDRGLPALRQSAEFLFLREGVFDGVLIAYGTHHVADRVAMCAEAFRVLRPGGRILVHDFEEGSPVARWFAEVVHHRTAAGHDYRHVTRAELHGLLRGTGFSDVSVTEVYDPIRLWGATETGAVDSLLRYLTAMYGLRMGRTDLLDWLTRNVRYDYGDVPSRTGGWCRELTVRRTGTGAVAELPRLALVATAVRRS